MGYSKERFDFFSDGVMAIIITIMVLEIPLTNTFKFNDLLTLLQSVIIFFASFIIVGSFWSKHNYVVNNLETVNGKIIWRNHLFLFFLALIPVFTKWVLENPNEIIPVICYDILYIVVNFSFIYLTSGVISKEKFQKIHEKHYEEREKKRNERSILHPIVMIIIVIILGIISFRFVLIPEISIALFIGFPIVSSLINLYKKKD
ncbi:TMEM175 family protein [Methanobrevibacter curvatus]|uniref:DUF1211 domain-containing protein n=1 Tax=Methanobrevibacter curvatus TaxID=49547 RepID=A0A162FIC2_9EURY|nr:TMEM175 family protein [Methanobrevibacter curvatus]KZX10420.1 hypothetical protein MBCUR_17910 [Methanobrevibacter curvatus]